MASHACAACAYHCLLTAGKWHISQVRQPLKPQEVGGHNLAAPHGTIRSIARAISSNPDYRPRQSLFSQHTGDMGVVMLYANFLRDMQVERVFRCQVFRMQIVCHRFGMDIEEDLEVLDSLAERGQRLEVLQVTYMVAYKGLSPLAQAKRVLEVPPAGQKRRREIEWQRDWLRRVAP